MKKYLTLVCILLILASTTFADWKISQRSSVAGADTGMIMTVYRKGVRQRTETKLDLDAETAAAMKQMGGMMSGMMPEMPVNITQCDLKQNLLLSETNKQYFIDYYDWSSVPPEKLARRGANRKVTIKGTVTVDAWIVDSGKRQKMFGLDARWLTFTMTSETSADACEKSPPSKVVMEGWFTNLSLPTESCPTNMPPPASGGCYPKTIYKRLADPGFFLTGTTKSYINGKLETTTSLETLQLSKATLDQTLFDVPATPWLEVDSMQDLLKKRTNIDTTAKTVFSDGSKAQKTIAIDYFSGSSTKLDQESLRNYISGKLSSSGMSGYLVSSSADISGGKFANVIGVEIKKVKESGGAKIGGLFGKITGSSDMAKAGNSTAEIIVTLYGPDGKTVVMSSPASADVKGSPNDAVKAAIDQVISGLLAKAK